MTIEYVDLETAQAASGIRIVTSALVPSPWSEALKGLLEIAGLRALCVRRGVDKDAIDRWTGIDNVPALLHDKEPVRTNWAALVGFVDRIAPERHILPTDIAARAHAVGLLDVLAGEGGIGWNARLAMIDAGLTSNGVAGFPPPLAKALGKRYGHTPEATKLATERIGAQLSFLGNELRGEYFGGTQPNAVDVYSATFLTLLATPLTEAECPNLMPMLRSAFTSAYTAFGSLVPAALLAHRERMFERHLPRPIVL